MTSHLGAMTSQLGGMTSQLGGMKLDSDGSTGDSGINSGEDSQSSARHPDLGSSFLPPISTRRDNPQARPAHGKEVAPPGPLHLPEIQSYAVKFRSSRAARTTQHRQVYVCDADDEESGDNTLRLHDVKPIVVNDHAQNDVHKSVVKAEKRASLQNRRSYGKRSSFSRPADKRRDSHRQVEVERHVTDAKLTGSKVKLRRSISRKLSRSDSQGARRRSRVFSEGRERLCRLVDRDVIGADNVITTQFGKLPVTYLDYIASGRCLNVIESAMTRHVMPSYANTHTDTSYNGQQTTKFREDAREIIRAAVNAERAEDKVIFTGSGATSAVHKIIHAYKPVKPLVLTGPYEHHSNILPWLDVPGAKVVRIRQDRSGVVDLQHLEQQLKKGQHRQIIASFSAASNVTGIITDVDAISSLVHKYHGVVLFDYACSGPYVNIDMKPRGGGLTYKDAVFISPHKFLGGPGTPGVLVAKRHMFRNEIPHGAGGGTVAFVRREEHRFHTDPEHREEGGTPAILGSIRAGLVFKLKETFTSSFIMAKEEVMLDRGRDSWAEIPNLIILGNLNVPRLPIFPMLFFNHDTGRFLHHDFVAMVMNDVFGLQVRSGCACAAPYGLDLMGMSETAALKFQELIVSCKNDKLKKSSKNSECKSYDNVIFKPGFVRLNLPYFISQSTLNFVLQAVKMVAENAWLLLPLYDFNRSTGSWWIRENSNVSPKKHLSDIALNLEQLLTNTLPEEVESLDSSWEDIAKSPIGDSRLSIMHQEILEHAQEIFENAKYSSHKISAKDIPSPKNSSRVKNVKTTSRHDDILNNSLRWFMLPQEAETLIAGRPVRPLPSDELPFFPGSLAKKLGLSDPRHKARGNMDSSFPLEFH